MARRRKGLVRVSLLLIAAGVIAGIAAAYGIAQNYGYLRASILRGAPGGRYYALGTRLADRAQTRARPAFSRGERDWHSLSQAGLASGRWAAVFA